MQQTQTCKEMLPAIGARVLVEFEQVRIACMVRDVKNSYGRVRLLVEPIYGAGEQWIEMARVYHSASLETLEVKR